MTLPDAIQIETTFLRDLSIECWRLGRAAEAAPDAPYRATVLRVGRSISAILTACGVQIVDFVGRSYDPGLVAEVIDVREEPGLGAEDAVVEETVVPTLLLRGQLLERGQIVVKRAPRHPDGEDVQ
jgi:hypothetical protein